MAIEGFEVPLHRSLTEPILLAGAPRSIAIVNGTVAAALGLGVPALKSRQKFFRSVPSPNLLRCSARAKWMKCAILPRHQARICSSSITN